MVLGSLSSWISSWIIYAIGEIAENTQVKRNDREISEKKWNDREISEKKRNDREISISEKKRIESVFKSYSSNQASTIQKRCPYCGDTVTSKICSMCNKENNLFT